MAVTDHAHPVDPERVAHARDRVLAAEDAARLSGLLGLLADPVRSRILSALDQVEELCVGDLALALEVSEDAACYGLRLLRTAGLVQNRKVGRVVYYRLADEFPEPLLAHCLRELITLTRAVGADDSSDAGAPLRGGAAMTHAHHDTHTSEGERLDQASPALATPTDHGAHADHHADHERPRRRRSHGPRRAR